MTVRPTVKIHHFGDPEPNAIGRACWQCPTCKGWMAAIVTYEGPGKLGIPCNHEGCPPLTLLLPDTQEFNDEVLQAVHYLKARLS